MSITCGTITDLTLSCTASASAGMYGDIWAYKHEDWESNTVTKTGKIISAITNASGVEAYKIQNESGMPSAGFVPVVDDSGKTMYQHTLNFFIDDRGSDGKSALEALSSGRWVFIARVKGGDAEDSFQVLGNNVGLINEGGGFDSTANNGRIAVTMSSRTSGTAEYESETPLNFWPDASDLAGTLAALAALETAPA